MDYHQWNDAIGDKFFQKGLASETVFLSVEPETLAQIARASGQDLNPEEAVKDFVDAVKEKLRLWGGWIPTRGLVQNRPYPIVLGLLALQVIAVFEMHAQEHRFGFESYWRSLRELLGQEPVERLPDGLSGTDHQYLWRELFESRFNHDLDGRLGCVHIPDENLVTHRHVRLPKSQSLLKRTDIDRLPLFFAEAGLCRRAT